MGLDLKTDVDLGLFMEAFSNVVAGSTMTINIDDLRKVLRQHDTYHTNQLRIETNKLIAEGPETKIKGEKFMDDMAKAPDIKKLASGVLYKVIKDGDGIMATPVDVATMTFHVSRIDGKEVWKIEHAPARVSDPLLPPGIREVVPMMKAGSHWMVYLPYTAAYGDKPGIPNAREGFMFAPYSAVVFDLEVEKVDPRPALPGNMMPPRGGGPPTTVNPVNPANPGAPAITTSPIVRVPSAAEMANGEQPRVMTEAEIEAAKIEAAKKALTNSPATAAASTNTNSGGRR
jgi:FKBP-type peptidyl-prolyl cis-trans isomerase